jgi:dTDP-4-dehydrorhamnose reductase
MVPSAVLLDRRDLDVTDDAAVRRQVHKHRPDVIIHCAAYTRVDAAEDQEEAAESVNVKGTGVVSAAAEEVEAMLVYPSTDYVFDGERTTYSEHDETAPLSVYGRTKLKGEEIAKTLPRHLIVRTSWVFGDGQNFVRSILAAASQIDELPVVDDQRGLPTYALDLADGIFALIQRDAAGVFHLAGGGDACTWADLAELALDAAGITAKIARVSTDQYSASRGGTIARRPLNSVLDCSKAARFGVTLRSWREAVAEYVKEIE